MNIQKPPRSSKLGLLRHLRDLKLTTVLWSATQRLAAACCLNCRHLLKTNALEKSLVLCSFCEQLHQTSLLNVRPNCLRCSLPFTLPTNGDRNSAEYNNRDNHKELKESYLDALICADCQKNPFSFDRCIAAAVFEGVPAQLVKHLKHRSKTSAAKYMAGQICAAVEHRIPTYKSSAPVDCLVPVPMQLSRLRQRGFNQAELIASSISRALSIPIDNKACKRIHTTNTQQLLNRRERKKNLQNAFEISATALVGKRIAIIDDVVTTGETANQLALAMLKAGALHCEVWCYARTGKPSDNLA